MIDAFASLLNQGFAYIVPMIVLLGLLIFVHELGHFLAAKYFKVRVEVFSLGFGRKILQFKKGDTQYCISILPLGGYVKMFGDEPGKEIPTQEKEYSFLHKPVGQRIVIALAGPVMNLFFAGLLFHTIAVLGEKAPAPIVGELASNSQAHELGFRNYDVIRSVNDHKIETWTQFENLVETSAGQSLSVHILRQGQPETLEITPIQVKNDNLFSTAETIGRIKGLNSKIHLPFIGVAPGGPFALAGFKNGDQILSINDQNIEWFKDIRPTLLEALYNEGGAATVKVKRYSDFRKGEVEKEFSIHLDGRDFTSGELGIFIPEMVIGEVQKDSPAEKIGLQRLDTIVSINGHEIHSFDDILKNVSGYEPDGAPLKFEIHRGDQRQTFDIVPKMNSLEGEYGEIENRFTVGVTPVLFSIPQSFTWKSPGFFHATGRALEQSWHWTKLTLLSFLRIVQNKVSSKNLSGFISIGQVAHKSWQIGAVPFLKMMAVISINLFILNLLPIPILDGGHLLLFTLEAIKGAPLSLRKIEVAQQIGFLIIIFLMAFALFNDFSRIFGS
ncbi:MAG: RIP metalloprotease RseP [Bdellovibrionales bacterium]|nr:RIP metalloprotease RseP [Bdellovibrionales bacterium]